MYIADSSKERARNAARQGVVMRMHTQDRWHCTNPACRCEVLVESNGSLEGKNPVCACGAAMKKKYASPVFTYLDFLKLEEPSEVAAREE
jgi:hypothetical protein